MSAYPKAVMTSFSATLFAVALPGPTILSLKFMNGHCGRAIQIFKAKHATAANAQTAGAQKEETQRRGFHMTLRRRTK